MKCYTFHSIIILSNKTNNTSVKRIIVSIYFILCHKIYTFVGDREIICLNIPISMSKPRTYIFKQTASLPA